LLNRIVIVKECDATELIRISSVGNTIINFISKELSYHN